LNYYEDWLVCRSISQVYQYVDEIIIGDCSRGEDYLSEFIKGLKKCKIVKDQISKRERPFPGLSGGTTYSPLLQETGFFG